ncbi:hypothetical protein B0H67DRAFT_316654 [Lasiosphaeris hirsuta]|uniref:PH domain-containing protein n=1 Tax=Lasiosphaeris hirsuta TaxID=260670 RepID=A0AA40A1I2_9PEZI|nr:hypothetical protein B0H67DRAFT_316654 [Lasiosphaeris hirsuta]
MSAQSPVAPSRQETLASNFSDEAVPDVDPSSTAGLLAERLQAWKHAVVYVEEYMESVEKIHKTQAKEYEKVLKTISKPLREGQHFDQSLGGVAGFFENMRVNTEALVNTNLDTEKSIRGSVLPVIERLHKEIKHKAKELAHGAQKSAKEVEKARNTTQKHIELLGQHTAAFESTGGKATAHDDPYVIHRGVIHRLSKQVMEENNHRNDLIAVQTNFQVFEAHIVRVLQEAMEAFNTYVGGQAAKVQALYADMLGAAQRIPTDFEWKAFATRCHDRLVDPNEDPRTVESIHFANMDHSSTKPLIEGTLERKSRNKLSWGTQTGYYVVTASKFLHEFKDSDNLRKDPTPELSIYLPEATIGAPSGEKFNVKGKDKSGTMGGKLAGTSELAFKAHTPAEAQKWFDIIRNVASANGPAVVTSPVPSTPSPIAEDKKLEAAPVAAAPAVVPVVTDHKAQEAGMCFRPLWNVESEGLANVILGVTGTETVASPTVAAPVAAAAPAVDTKAAAPADAKETAVASPIVPPSATDEKASLPN